jgi:hypothetical protein
MQTEKVPVLILHFALCIFHFAFFQHRRRCSAVPLQSPTLHGYAPSADGCRRGTVAMRENCRGGETAIRMRFG